MKAVLQNFRSGELTVSDVPPPALRANGVLVRNVASLVSGGTEKAVTELARMNLIAKARARPDLVKKVLARAGQEGLLGTAQVVMNLVSAPLPLGYSCAGVVEAVGSRVSDLQPGDRVACAGLGYANHAEVVYVPRNLAVRFDDALGFEEASFVTVGAIAMQGWRQTGAAVGDRIVVLGLGLVGQLMTQIAAASGCRVFGIDLDPAKVELARSLGMQDGLALGTGDAAAAVRRFTDGYGADAVIICAATKSSDPIHLAPELVRDRARVVVVGDVGMDVPRRAYYEKELELLQSRSYGPGRYDPIYEEQGVDYPIGYVRWTENRNMSAVLELAAAGRVRLAPLVTHRFRIEQATAAYDLLSGERREPYLGIVLQYDASKPQPRVVATRADGARTAARTGELRFGIVGAGQFAQGILLPKLRRVPGVRISGVATASGLTSLAVARKVGAEFCTSEASEILTRPDIDAVLIATRHDHHAHFAAEALGAGKHVFVEKPLAIDAGGLAEVLGAHERASAAGAPRVLMVGFNRRFSPYAAAIRDVFAGSLDRLAITYRVNAGAIPPTNWVHDPAVGGGRIVGEVCHFVDLLQYLTASLPAEVFALAVGPGTPGVADPDSLIVQVRMANGSVGCIGYLSSGDPRLSKERLEVVGGGMAAVVDNWRSLDVLRPGGAFRRRSRLASAKGHAEELAAFVQGIRQGRAPIPLADLVATTEATFAIRRSLRSGKPEAVGTKGTNAEPA